MAKTIQLKLNKRLLINLLKSIVISLIVIFILEHFGRIEYKNPRSDEYYVIYHTFFGGSVYSDTNFLTKNNYPKFGEVETYTELLPYRILATIYSEEDFVAFLILTGIIWLIFIFKQYVRIKIE